MQYLFLVVGGELESLEDVRFRDPEHLHFVGAFATREEATQAWRANAYQTVDNALMRYFVLTLHDLMESHRPLLNAAEMAAHYRKRNGERPLAPLDDLI